MFMGRRRPLLRAAAVAGGSYVAGKHAAARRQRDEEQDARINTLEAQQSVPAQAGPAPAGSAPAGPAPSIADELSRLAQLHQSGALTDQEFADAKAGLLGSSR